MQLMQPLPPLPCSASVQDMQLKNNGSFVWPTIVQLPDSNVSARDGQHSGFRRPLLHCAVHAHPCSDVGKPFADACILQVSHTCNSTAAQVVLADSLIYHDDPRCSPETVEVRGLAGW